MTRGQGSRITLPVAIARLRCLRWSASIVQALCILLIVACVSPAFAQDVRRADDKDKIVPPAATAPAFTPPPNPAVIQDTKPAQAADAKATPPDKTAEAKPATLPPAAPQDNAQAGSPPANSAPASAPVPVTGSAVAPAADDHSTVPPAGSSAPAAAEDAPVHVEPRTISKPESGKPEIPTPPDIPGIKTRTKPIIKDVNLVLVPVTITDPMNRLVTGLEKENFQVYEGDKTQPIQSFSSEDAPISLGVIFDVSGSMADKIQKSRDAVVEFFKTANPQDEFFMITFADKPELIADFTRSVEEVQDKMITIQAKGRTALLDAIYLGIDKMRNAHNQKKALLIISDGGDNRSRYTEGEIKNLVREADVQIYAIGIYEAAPPTPEERAGPGLLTDISEVTGGRTFSIDNASELADVASKIGVELRNQYVIGYRPTNSAHDGKWRKIKVKLNPPKGLPPLHVYAKTGYYAPNQ